MPVLVSPLPAALAVVLVPIWGGDLDGQDINQPAFGLGLVLARRERDQKLGETLPVDREVGSLVETDAVDLRVGGARLVEAVAGIVGVPELAGGDADAAQVDLIGL